MEIFWKTASAVLICSIIVVFLQKQGKEIAVLLSLTACVMVCGIAVWFLEPVISFLTNLKAIASLDSDLFAILLKAVAIGVICEISVAVCSDSGNAALGKSLQILGGGVIMWLSIPLLERVLDLVQQILEGL